MGLQELAGRGTHPAFADLAASCDLRDTHLLRRLERTVSALAWWRPELRASHLLPAAVFPFIMCFGKEPLACFEAGTAPCFSSDVVTASWEA